MVLMANHRKAWRYPMKSFELFLGVMLILLGACQSNQFIPVVSPTSSEVRLATSLPSPQPMEFTEIPATPIATEMINKRPTLEPTSLEDSIDTSACLQATFLTDVSIPDGMTLAPEEVFLKIWRLENSGECSWPADLRLIHLAGEPFGGSVELPANYYPAGVPLIASMGERMWAELEILEVHPGDTIDLPILFQAPTITGEYFSLWALHSPESGEDLLQIYADIRVEGSETPEPKPWGGEWAQLNRYSDGNPIPLMIEQRGVKVVGYFYTPTGELILFEGGLFDEGMRVEGTYGPPYDDGFPFTWQLSKDGRSFQGIYRDRIVSAGAWCGARPGTELPIPCVLNP
jgi:hypothetical protein